MLWAEEPIGMLNRGLIKDGCTSYSRYQFTGFTSTTVQILIPGIRGLIEDDCACRMEDV
jgi:hypothetical protein